MHKLLVIQTAFTGDVVLATAVVEKLHLFYPDARIDFLLRKGNEGLLASHPFIERLWIWDKKKAKNKHLLELGLAIRKEQFTHIINLHRFGSSGFITFLSGAKYKVGFDKNPFSFCYTRVLRHRISAPYADAPITEIMRNVVQLRVPMLVDVKKGANWNQAK
jgi:heptosyltransferase-2